MVESLRHVRTIAPRMASRLTHEHENQDGRYDKTQQKKSDHELFGAGTQKSSQDIPKNEAKHHSEKRMLTRYRKESMKIQP